MTLINLIYYILYNRYDISIKTKLPKYFLWVLLLKYLFISYNKKLWFFFARFDYQSRHQFAYYKCIKINVSADIQVRLGKPWLFVIVPPLLAQFIWHLTFRIIGKHSLVLPQIIWNVYYIIQYNMRYCPIKWEPA